MAWMEFNEFQWVLPTFDLPNINSRDTWIILGLQFISISRLKYNLSVLLTSTWLSSLGCTLFQCLLDYINRYVFSSDTKISFHYRIQQNKIDKGYHPPTLSNKVTSHQRKFFSFATWDFLFMLHTSNISFQISVH